MKQPTNRRQKQKGATLVESALVLVALVSMIVFVIEFGRILLLQEYITQRVAMTARRGAVSNWTATMAANFLCYESTTAPTGATAGFLGLKPSQVSYQLLGTAGTPDYRVQVKVTGVPVLTVVPGMAGSYTLAPFTATVPAQSLGAAN